MSKEKANRYKAKIRYADSWVYGKLTHKKHIKEHIEEIVV